MQIGSSINKYEDYCYKKYNLQYGCMYCLISTFVIQIDCLMDFQDDNNNIIAPYVLKIVFIYLLLLLLTKEA